MAYVIGNDCVACGTCIDECPVGAISAGDDKYSINPDMCTGAAPAQVSARARLSAFRKGHAKKEKKRVCQNSLILKKSQSPDFHK